MFLVYSTDDGHVHPWEYFEAQGLIPRVGMALNLNGGKLVLATGDAVPQFICMRTQDIAVAEGEVIPVIRISHDAVYEVPATGTLAVGNKVSIAADGMSVAAGEGAGVVVDVVEDRVRVRF